MARQNIKNFSKDVQNGTFSCFPETKFLDHDDDNFPGRGGGGGPEILKKNVWILVPYI